MLCVMCVALLFFSFFFIVFSSIDRRSYHVFCMVKSCNNHVVVVVSFSKFVFFFCRPAVFCFFVVVYLRACLPRAVALLSATARVCSQELQRAGGGGGGACAGQHARTSALVHINGSRKMGLIKGGEFSSCFFQSKNFITKVIFYFVIGRGGGGLDAHCLWHS